MAKSVVEPTRSGEARNLVETSGVKDLKPREEKAPLGDSHQIGVAAAYRGVNLRATGLYAGALASAAAFGAVLFWGDPTKNAAHFLWCVIMAYICGAFTNAIMVSGRIADALAEKENYRREGRRIADERNRLQDQFLATRISSEKDAPQRARR